MQASQDETTQLLRKIAVQDELIEKLQAEQAKLTTYIKQFRETMEKKLNREPESGKNNIDEQKMEKQLEKELESAKLMLKNYQNQLKALQKKCSKNKFTPDNLIEMELEIKKKQAYLRELNDDIKNLNIVRRKQEKMIEKKEKNEDGNKLSKIVEEIRKQRQILDALKIKHHQKQQALQKRRQNVQQIQKQYMQKCAKYGEKPITFEQFKQKRVQKRRQQSVTKMNGEYRKELKKPIQTVKDIINSHLDIENVEISQKGLNELIQKKVVMQNSLKIASKKFQREIEQLSQRVEELRLENESLNTKYLEKKKEKELIQTAKTTNFKRNSSKTIKRLDPIK